MAASRSKRARQPEKSQGGRKTKRQKTSRGSKKSQSTSSKKAHGGAKEPNLAKFLDAPVDIVEETLSYLHPVDLLNVARSCQTLRTFMTCGTMNRLWRNARLAMAEDDEVFAYLPECPPFLSETEYTELMLSPECQLCGKPATRKVLWGSKARYCKDCHEARISSGNLRSMLLYADTKKTKQLHGLMKTLPQDTENLILNYGGKYHVPDIDDLRTFLIEISKMSLDARETAIAVRLVHINELRSFHDACAAFEEKRYKAHGPDSIRMARLEVVKNYLIAQGYEDEMADEFYTDRLFEFDFIQKPLKPLTAAGLKKLIPDIELAMEDMQDDFNIQGH